MFNETRLLRRSWPDRSIDLLIKACILPIDDARRAWTQWIDRHDVDDANWHEARLLSALSPRLGELDPNSPVRPRLNGLARAHWTRTQFTLRESTEAIELLDRAGIPCLLIKGAAQYAEGLATRRILADIDVLVRAENVAKAIDLLAASGWLGGFGESAAYLRAIGDLRISTNLLKGQYGEIDIHRTPFHYRRADAAADKLLWTTARPALLNGKATLVPSPAASVLITLAHSIQGEGGDWAIDVAERLKHQAIDWDAFVELATRWRLILPMRAGLLYLTDQLGLCVPTDVTRGLAGMPSDWAERLKLWGSVRENLGRPLADRIVNRFANRALAKRGYELPLADEMRLRTIQPFGASPPVDLINTMLSARNKLTIIRPQRLAALTLFRNSEPLPLEPATTWGTSARLSVGSGNQASRLAIEIEFVAPQDFRWIYFDLARGDSVFARIRTRAGGRSAGALRRVAAPVALPPGQDRDITIEARPTKFIRPTATPAEHKSSGAVPFRVVRAGVTRGPVKGCDHGP